jgi:hypothetical protein
MNNDKQSADPFASFYRLEEAAVFFLHDAFEHAYLAAQLEVAGLIFGEHSVKACSGLGRSSDHCLFLWATAG